MKPSQIVVSVIVLVGLIGGLTFIRQWNIPKPEGPPKDIITPPPSRSGRLVPLTSVRAAPYCEVNRTGHQDFCFENPNPEPVDVDLKSKSCTCANVQLG